VLKQVGPTPEVVVEEQAEQLSEEDEDGEEKDWGWKREGSVHRAQGHRMRNAEYFDKLRILIVDV